MIHLTQIDELPATNGDRNIAQGAHTSYHEN
jgi:hypothetical protein